VVHPLDISVAIETRDFDNPFRMDFGKVKVLDIANHKPIKVAKFYSSRLSETDFV
jgi:hypothetical protein